MRSVLKLKTWIDAKYRLEETKSEFKQKTNSANHSIDHAAAALEERYARIDKAREWEAEAEKRRKKGKK